MAYKAIKRTHKEDFKEHFIVQHNVATHTPCWERSVTLTLGVLFSHFCHLVTALRGASLRCPLQVRGDIPFHAGTRKRGQSSFGHVYMINWCVLDLINGLIKSMIKDDQVPVFSSVWKINDLELLFSS